MTEKYVEIWLAEYPPDRMKKTQMVIKASKMNVTVTDDKRALDRALGIIADSEVALMALLLKRAKTRKVTGGGRG